MNGKVSVVFNRNSFSKMKDFSRLQAVTNTAKVVVSEMVQDAHFYYTQLIGSTCTWLIDLCHCNDLEGHSPVARLFKYNLSKIYATFCTGSTDKVHRVVHQ